MRSVERRSPDIPDNAVDIPDNIIVRYGDAIFQAPRGTSLKTIEKWVSATDERKKWQQIKRNYILTHKIWNMPKDYCLICGRSRMQIHMNREVCSGFKTKTK